MRIRTLKPDFWQSEKIAALPMDTRLLAIALLNYSDDEGYFKAHPSLVKAACFPLDESVNIRRMLDELSRMGYITLGTEDSGAAIGRVVKFGEHQRIDRPSKSKLSSKTITWMALDETSSNNHRAAQEGSLLEVEQGTGNKERKERAPAAPPFSPINLIPTTEHHELAGAWSAWVSYRKGLSGKKLLEQSWRGQADNFRAWFAEGLDVNAIVKHSIDNAYTGLFPDKFRKKPRPQRDFQRQQITADSAVEQGNAIGVMARPGETTEAYLARLNQEIARRARTEEARA